MAKSEKENFIDIAVGDVRLRFPDDLASILIAKRHIDALYKSFADVPSSVHKPERIEISTQDQTETIEPIKEPSAQKLSIIEEQKVIKADQLAESYKVCPLCNGKLKKKRIRRIGDEIRQTIVCKNKECNFQREYVFSI